MNNWPDIRESSLVYEDEGVLGLNKPAGISVMGERHETDLVEMAAESGERLYPVHRIDKVTSGVVLFAKELRFHGPLTRQFNKRTVEKAYLAVTRSTGLPERGTIDLPLAVGRKNRVRIAGNRDDIEYDETRNRWSLPPGSELPGKRNYPSLTTFARVWESGHGSLVVVRPVTGRRHQIRVHLAWTGHPIAGDPLFGGSAEESAAACLHSWRLAVDADWSATGRLVISAPPPAGFWNALQEPDMNAVRLLERAEAELTALPGPPPRPRARNQA